MTLEEIKNSDRLWLTPAEVAPVVGCDPNQIRNTAQSAPHLLGFPVTVVGTRTKIWRKPFLAFIGEREGGEAVGKAE